MLVIKLTLIRSRDLGRVLRLELLEGGEALRAVALPLHLLPEGLGRVAAEALASLREDPGALREPPGGEEALPARRLRRCGRRRSEEALSSRGRGRGNLS